MSSSSLIMVHIAPCFQALMPFVHQKCLFGFVCENMQILHQLGHLCPMDTFKVFYINCKQFMYIQKYSFSIIHGLRFFLNDEA